MSPAVYSKLLDPASYWIDICEGLFRQKQKRHSLNMIADQVFEICIDAPNNSLHM